jgi:hypothetical protein
VDKSELKLVLVHSTKKKNSFSAKLRHNVFRKKKKNITMHQPISNGYRNHYVSNRFVFKIESLDHIVENNKWIDNHI